jgi:hypothetical protein
LSPSFPNASTGKSRQNSNLDKRAKTEMSESRLSSLFTLKT